MVAVEDSGSEGQFGFHCCTGRACLRRRIETVDRDQTCATVVAFGGQDLAELAERDVGESAGQRPIVGHPGNIEVFDDHGVEPASELVGQHVVGHLARRGDTTVNSCPPSQEPGPVLRSRPAAGNATVKLL